MHPYFYKNQETNLSKYRLSQCVLSIYYEKVVKVNPYIFIYSYEGVINDTVSEQTKPQDVW